MNTFIRITGFLAFFVLIVSCHSMPKHDVAGDRAPAAAKKNPAVIRDTDEIRIKISRVQTVNIPDSGPVFLSAHLFLCARVADQNTCRPLGNTSGVPVSANQDLNYDRESNKTMPALFSTSVPGNTVNALSEGLPLMTAGVPFLRIELQKAEEGKSPVVLGSKTIGLPPITLVPNNPAMIILNRIEMLPVPGRSPYGAVVNILIHRAY